MAENDDWGGAEPFQPEGGADRGSGTPEGQGGRPQVHVNAIAEDIMAARRFLVPASGVLHEYDPERGYWARRSKRYLFALAKRADVRTSQRRRGEIDSFIRAAVHDEAATFGRCAPQEIACANGVLDVVTGKMRAHRAEDFLDSVIPHKYAPAAGAQRWEQALIEWFGDAEGGAEKIAAMQEFFGYLCLSHALFKKAIVFYGEKSNTGKSRPIKALKFLAGARWTSALGVGQMDDPVMVSVLVGKRLNVQGELSANAMIRDGNFKTIVATEEPIFCNPKYEDPFEFVPVVKVAIACNTLPRVDEATGATFGRLLLIPFSNVIEPARQDPGIDAVFEAEIEGIFAWAVVGAKRLIENGGQFTKVSEGETLVADWRAESNPMIGFLAAEMVKEVGAKTALVDIARRAKDRGYIGKVDARWAGRLLRAHLGATCIENARAGAGAAPARCLMGWHLLGAPLSE